MYSLSNGRHDLRALLDDPGDLDQSCKIPWTMAHGCCCCFVVVVVVVLARSDPRTQQTREKTTTFRCAVRYTKLCPRSLALALSHLFGSAAASEPSGAEPFPRTCGSSRSLTSPAPWRVTVVCMYPTKGTINHTSYTIHSR